MEGSDFVRNDTSLGSHEPRKEYDDIDAFQAYEYVRSGQWNYYKFLAWHQHKVLYYI
jgi:hypothetical protein